MAGRLVALLPRSGVRFVGGALKPPAARPEPLEGSGGVVGETGTLEHSPPRKQSLPLTALSLGSPSASLSPLSRFVETLRASEWRHPRASFPGESFLRVFSTSASVPSSPLLARVLRLKEPPPQPQCTSISTHTSRADEFLLCFEEQCLDFAGRHRELKGLVDNMSGVLATRRGESTEAVARFTLAAEADNVAAKFNLALAYQLGRGVVRDEQRALTLYRKAAVCGHPAACLNLAAMLLDASRGPEAAPWLARAADLGNNEACITLALHLLSPTNELSLPQDTTRAVSLLRAAAARGSSEADRYLGLCAARGLCDTSPTPSPNPTPLISSMIPAPCALPCKQPESFSFHVITPTSKLTKQTTRAHINTRRAAALISRAPPQRVPSRSPTRTLTPTRSPVDSLVKLAPTIPDRPRSARPAVRGDHRRAASR